MAVTLFGEDQHNGASALIGLGCKNYVIEVANHLFVIIEVLMSSISILFQQRLTTFRDLRLLPRY
jgi:hypothetical protein